MITTKKIKNLIEEPITGEWGEEGLGVKVLRTTNFSNDGSLDLRDVVERSIEASKIKRKQLLLGDIILEKSGGSPSQPVGRVVYFDIQDENIYLCNNFTTILRTTKETSSKYLFWFLFYNHQTNNTLKFQNKTTGILNLQLSRYLESLHIPYPPAKTQQKIATILDKADELRRKDKLLLEKYNELLQSIFYKMFGDPVKNEKGWKQVELRKCCLQITDGTHFSPPNQTSGIPYITARHVKTDGLNFYLSPTYVSKKDHDVIYSRCKPEKGDVLYIKDGATTGIAAINNYDFEFSMLSSLALIKPNSSCLNNYYLVSWLNNEDVKQMYLRMYMAGAAIRRFTLQKINKFLISLPPIEDQIRFSEIAQTVLSQRRIIKDQSIKSENLFNTLLQKAFKGELIK